MFELVDGFVGSQFFHERIQIIVYGLALNLQVSVREGSGATVDHPVHVGGEGLVLAELKVNPEVKRVALK